MNQITIKWSISHHMEAHTEFQQPALSVGVEEGVREVVPIILWDLKGLILDAVVQVLQRLGGIWKRYNTDYWVAYEQECRQDICWESRFIETLSCISWGGNFAVKWDCWLWLHYLLKSLDPRAQRLSQFHLLGGQNIKRIFVLPDDPRHWVLH